MAKRQRAGKKDAKKAKGKGTAGKAVKPSDLPTVNGKAARRVKLPQDRALPGMGKARITRLDNLCHGLAEVRATMAACRSEEGDLERAALAVMHQHNVNSYQASGVELVRVPGEEKLRVRVSKANATAEIEEAEGEGQGMSGLDAITDDGDGFEQSGEFD